MIPEAGGRWWNAGLTEVRRVCRLTDEEVRMVEVGHCASFAVPQRGLFVRIGCVGSESQAANAVRFAKVCSAMIAGIVEPAEMGFSQPLSTQSGPVTFWPLLESVDGDIDYAWFGATLRSIHDVSGAPMTNEHRQTNPALAASRLKRLRQAPYVGDEVVAHCADLMARIRTLRERVLPTLLTGLIHGDAYAANVVNTPQRPFLIDYDTAGHGPLYWDLAPILVSHRRFGTPAAAVDQMFAAYGRDPRDDPAFWEVVRVREWGAITYLIDLASADQSYYRELVRRLRTADGAGVWRGLDELRAEGRLPAGST
ncbi:aminoglycoside phosphotransferase family protein [Nocardia abscessus]|uniref:Aminoglycoside phosphotransferase family protein n=1 Tax=Nocardia abscessus TaxID=120957 RepID=A0ABS0CG90_9NOCA|nr:aminoglycoside phosphotransferase family protein [Nocardia abscessus]MBF6228512.1 aminoglycoside phosphotransferase family protein [Nocardia abscessus]